MKTGVDRLFKVLIMKTGFTKYFDKIKYFLINQMKNSLPTWAFMYLSRSKIFIS